MAAVRALMQFAVAMVILALGIAATAPGAHLRPSLLQLKASSSATSACPPARTRGLEVHGVQRRYHVQAPCGGEAKFAVLALQPGSVGPSGRWKGPTILKRYGGLVDRWGFLLIVPEGLPGGAFGSWNGEVCCGQALENGYDDSGFLKALVGVEAPNLPTFGVGFGDGAFLLSKVARDQPGLLAGVFVLAGHVYSGLNWLPQGQSAILIHWSRGDQEVRLGGCCKNPSAPVCLAPGIPQRAPSTCVSTPEIFGYWLGANRCSGEKKTKAVDRIYGEYVCREGTGCALPTKYCEYSERVRHEDIMGTANPEDVLAFFREPARSNANTQAHLAALFGLILFWNW